MDWFVSQFTKDRKYFNGVLFICVTLAVFREENTVQRKTKKNYWLVIGYK